MWEKPACGSHCWQWAQHNSLETWSERLTKVKPGLPATSMTEPVCRPAHAHILISANSKLSERAEVSRPLRMQPRYPAY